MVVGWTRMEDVAMDREAYRKLSQLMLCLNAAIYAAFKVNSEEVMFLMVWDHGCCYL